MLSGDAKKCLSVPASVDPILWMQNPEEYCDCELFLAAAHAEAGRVHKHMGDYGDADKRFEKALTVLGYPLRADAESR